MLRCYSDHVAIESQETRENKWNTLPNKTTAAFGPNDLTYTLLISNTFISNARLKLAKNKPNAKKHTEAELLLYENYLHYSSILSSKNNSSYSNSKKQAKEQMCLYSKDYTISHKNGDENEKHHIETTWTDLNLDMATNIANIKSVSVWWWCLYVLTNTDATLEAQFMKKMS